MTQTLLIQRTVKKFGDLRPFTVAFFFITLAFVAYFFSRSLSSYLVIVFFFATANSFISPLIQTILSKQTDAKSQGSIQGLNASYMSIGNIVGPIVGGVIAQQNFYPCTVFTCCGVHCDLFYHVSFRKGEKYSTRTRI